MTVSVIVWRETFSVCTVMAGSFFRNAKKMKPASTSTNPIAMTTNFPRPLRLAFGVGGDGDKTGGACTPRACRKKFQLSSAGNFLALS
jgi:hypothetical protein